MKNSFDHLTASMASVSLACLVVLGGCGPQNGEPVAKAATKPAATQTPAKTAAAAPQAPVPVYHLGEVRHIETLTERPKGTGVGAVAGGVLGGVVGHQVGDGRGQQAADRAAAPLARRERIFGDALPDLEGPFAPVTAVVVGGHGVSPKKKGAFAPRSATSRTIPSHRGV